jgi:hypothetical protein
LDVYRVSIALAMSSNHAAVLSALSSHLLKADAHVSQLNSNFGRLKTAITGALSVTAGMALFGVMEKIVDKTKDYSDELVKLQRLGGDMTKAVVSGDVQKRAFDISQRVPMTVTDLMKIPGASYSILGQEDSMKVWEQLAQFSWVMQSQKDFKGNAGEDLQKFLRAGELGGRLTDPKTHKAAIEELQKFLDLSAKVMAATHNMVTPSTLLGMSQQAGFSMRGMTDEGFMNMAITAQAMGGPRAGTAMLSLYNQMAGGKMTPKAAAAMESLGLLKSNEWEQAKGGGVIVADEAKKRLEKLVGKNPMDFVDNILEDLEKRGINDPADQRRMMADALSRQTTQRFVIEQMMNREQIAAERERMGQGLGSGSSFDLIMNQSVTANIEALKSAWTNLLIAVAGPNSENVISLLQTLTSSINAITRAVNQTNPETLKDLGKGLAALGLALTAGGVAALIAAMGPAGWIVTGIGALVAAAAKWGPDILKGVYSGLEGIADAMNRFIAWLGTIVAKIKGFFGGGSGAGEDDSINRSNEMLKHLNRFEPGVGGPVKPQPISLSLNIDGRTLAQAVSQQQDALYRYETNPTAFNGSGRYGA